LDLAQTAEGPFHNPALGKYSEAAYTSSALNYSQTPLALRFALVGQFLANRQKQRMDEHMMGAL
jgi:hypothetical protein